MSDKRECLVVVHPGSALGSANMNLGKFEARAARDALASAFEQWAGDVVVIHGGLSDELPYYPHLQQALHGMLARNRTAGHQVAEMDGDDDSVHNQEVAMDEWLTDQACEPGSIDFRVTGAWYHPADGGGCVGSVIDRLRKRGHAATVDDSAVTLESDVAEDDVEESLPNENLAGQVSLPAQERPLPTWPEHLDSVLNRARAQKWTGFGGECFAHAHALASILWPDQEVMFSGAFNRAFYEHGQPIGHVAIQVMHEGEPVYLDADGRPKAWEAIESWGMLDAEDLDYAEQAEDLGIDWNETVANDVVHVTLTGGELLNWIDSDTLARARQALTLSPSTPHRPRRGRPG